jgi:hypothetical protein
MPTEDTATSTTRTAQIALVTGANKGFRKRASSPERSSLDSSNPAIDHRDTFLEEFGAELTQAAYAVILRHGAVDNWLELELELWKVLKETVRKWDEEWPSAGVMLVASCNPFAGPVPW